MSIIVDRNLYSPLFGYDRYEKTILETALPGDVLLTVQATDQDDAVRIIMQQ